jgi:hypothetical protein
MPAWAVRDGILHLLLGCVDFAHGLHGAGSHSPSPGSSLHVMCLLVGGEMQGSDDDNDNMFEV